MGIIPLVVVFLALAAVLSFLGIRQMGRASQFTTMAIFSAAILFGLAAIMSLTFFNIGGHT